MKKHQFNLTFILFLIFSSSVVANNGVVEINQACVAIGCFSGDNITGTGGFPVEIDGTAGKSYRLTSDLIVPNEDTTAIFVEASYITIDLNGFSIFGLQNNVTEGTGYGIYSERYREGILVKSGIIKNMGNSGVSLGYRANIHDLNVSHNGGLGVYVDNGSIVNNSTIVNNFSGGILAKNACIISNNIVYRNDGSYGISVTHGSNVFNNVIDLNGDYAIEFLLGTSSYRGNTLGFGVSAFTGPGSGINMGANLCNSAICPATP